MNASRPQSRFRQRGIVSIVAAIILIAVVILVLSQTHDILGNTSNTNQTQRDSVAAFFLAESGIERAQAVISSAATAGTLSNTTCSTTGIGSGPFLVGGGEFQYTFFESSPTGGCGGANQPACSACTVEVRGRFDTSARVIRTTISTTPSEGLAGCGSEFTIPMPVSAPRNGVVFSHVAYRAKPSDSGCSVGSFNNNARVGSCVNNGGSCDVTGTGDFWDLQGTGDNSISSFGVSASAPATGDYTITTRLEKGGGTRGGNPSVVRDYAQAAVLFYPPVSSPQSSVEFMGSYGTGFTMAGNNNSPPPGKLPNDWTCQPQSATTSNKMFRAAASDALVFGFSGWNANAGETSLSAVTLGIQPMRRLTSINGTQAEPVYSQIWMSYNPGYYPSSVSPQLDNTQTVTGATNGADFTGATGAVVTGSITGTTLDVTGVTGGLLREGDILTGTGVTTTPPTTVGTLGGAFTGTGGVGTYPVNQSQSVSSTTLTASSNVLRVTAVSYGVLMAGDTVSSGISGTPPTLTFAAFATPGAVGSGGTGEYKLDINVPPVTSATSMQIPRTRIGVPNSVTIPAVGTAVAVSSGTGAFTSTVFTGSITDDQLTATLTGGAQLCPGDALFSGGFKEPLPSILEQGIKSNTTVISPAVCSTTGPFTLSRPVDVDVPINTTIVARAAVTGVLSATSFTVSRQPTTRLSGAAVVCGGVCAMFYDAAGTLPNPRIGFTLVGFASANDWSSGFACLKGIDSANIQTLGKKVAKRSLWTEVVQ